MKEVIISILLIHGVIHLIGFAKAFHVDGIDQFEEDISKVFGLGWLLTCLLLISSAILLLINNPTWIDMSLLGITFSQILIMRYWIDAKTGMIINLILLVAIVINFNT